LVLRLDQAHLLPGRVAPENHVPAEVPLGSSLPPGLSPGATKPPASSYILRLFVSGHSVTTEETLKTLHHYLAELLPHPYTLKVIDVLKQPEQAELDQVIATPTLVKAWPLPARKLVGGLNQPDKLARLLRD
jgi:circadian clock protein KaiB